jgi:transposase
MPTKRLIKRLEELCKEYGIKLHVTPEAYRSKASFIDRDCLYEYGEKPKSKEFSGKRTTRDQYKTKDGRKVHADLNAAGNILRKVIYAQELSRTRIIKLLRAIDGVLTAPKRYDIFGNMKKKYRKQTSRRMVLTDLVTSA